MESTEPNIFRDFGPEDFEFDEPRATWHPPCWIHIGMSIRAVKEPAKSTWWLPLMFEIGVDAFSHRAVQQQLGSRFYESVTQQIPSESRWREFFYRRYQSFSCALEKPISFSGGL